MIIVVGEEGKLLIHERVEVDLSKLEVISIDKCEERLKEILNEINVKKGIDGIVSKIIHSINNGYAFKIEVKEANDNNMLSEKDLLNLSAYALSNVIYC